MDDEEDEPSAAHSPVSDRLPSERSNHNHDDDDDDGDGRENVIIADAAVEQPDNIAPPCSEQLPPSRNPQPPPAVCRHNAEDRGPPDDDFRSLLLSTSRHTVSGGVCQDGGAGGRMKHCSGTTNSIHTSAAVSRRHNKTSHHVNRWRAETNQL